MGLQREGALHTDSVCSRAIKSNEIKWSRSLPTHSVLDTVMFPDDAAADIF